MGAPSRCLPSWVGRCQWTAVTGAIGEAGEGHQLRAGDGEGEAKAPTLIQVFLNERLH